MNKTDRTAQRQVSIWLVTGIFMVLFQILLGGITRLTGSGLSITEWKPLMGVFPPVSHADWDHSFEQYRQIAQFKKLNNHFNLADYQVLFYWEWLHREWARLMGLVFLLPFFVFLWQKKVNRKLGWRLAGVFLLGVVQGLAGWVMVQSGLNDTDVSVSHIRLAVHFFLALVLLVYLFWLFLTIRLNSEPGLPSKRLWNMTLMIIILFGIQLIYGAFMAGTHAALYARTWPDINGFFLPVTPDLLRNFLRNVSYDPLLIQFIHRLLAYLLTALIFTWFFLTRQLPVNTWLFCLKSYPLMLVILQVCLGIACLLNSEEPIFIWLAVLHQLNGILLLLSMVAALYFSRKVI